MYEVRRFETSKLRTFYENLLLGVLTCLYKCMPRLLKTSVLIYKFCSSQWFKVKKNTAQTIWFWRHEMEISPEKANE